MNPSYDERSEYLAAISDEFSCNVFRVGNYLRVTYYIMAAMGTDK